MRTLTFCLTVLSAAALSAQGPPPGGRGPGPDFGRGFGIMAAGPASRTPVTGAPYSAVQTTQFLQVLAGGNQISRQEQAKVYRDRDGRVRMERTFTPPGSTTAETMITIFDPVGGFSYLLNPAKLTAVKMPLHSGNPGPMGQGRRGPSNSAPQVQTDNLGTQTVNGVSATGTRTTETIPAGAIGNTQPIQVVRTTWVSTDLKVPVQITSSDPRFGNTTMNLTSITQSEPDASLFQVPSTYTVTTRPENGFGRGFGGGGAPMRRRPQQAQ